MRDRVPLVASRAGFTLMEILLVLGLIGIVSAIAIRSSGDTIMRDRVNKVAAVISADLEQGFALAARQRTPIRVLIDSATMQISIAERSDTTMKYRTRQLKTGDMALGFISASRTNIDILPSGLSADTLSLRLGIYSKGGTTYSRTLRMTRAGMVRIK
jgi:prepilin-type N-terminal cleavage/methylation domain-containing protein